MSALLRRLMLNKGSVDVVGGGDNEMNGTHGTSSSESMSGRDDIRKSDGHLRLLGR